MSTKYQLSDIRTQLLDDIKEAYPTSFEKYEAADPQILGERVFYRKTHPNAVLALFIECEVTFALPFAFYRASRRGLKSLRHGDFLSLETQSVTLNGLGLLKAAELKAAKSILFRAKNHDCEWFLSVYRSGKAIYTHVDGNPSFRAILDSMTKEYDDLATDILTALKFENASRQEFCLRCIRKWSDLHREVGVVIWRMLPAIFQLEFWRHLVA